MTWQKLIDFQVASEPLFNEAKGTQKLHLF